MASIVTLWRRFGLGLCAGLIVVVAHAAVLAAAFGLATEPEVPVEPPTMSGVLVPAPPAEAVQAPAASAEAEQSEPPPEPKPEPEPEPETKPAPEPPPEPEPETEPESEPEPQPEPETRPEPEPEPQPEPEPEPEPERERVSQPQPKPAAEPTGESPAQQATEALARLDAPDDASEGAPVVQPRADAAHLNNPAPSYPRRSRRLGEEGRVVLEVLILPDGSVGDIRLTASSGHRRLDRTALDAVRRWQYVPATRAGEPIPYWYRQPIQFALE